MNIFSLFKPRNGLECSGYVTSVLNLYGSSIHWNLFRRKKTSWRHLVFCKLKMLNRFELKFLKKKTNIQNNKNWGIYGVQQWDQVLNSCCKNHLSPTIIFRDNDRQKSHFRSSSHFTYFLICFSHVEKLTIFGENIKWYRNHNI